MKNGITKLNIGALAQFNNALETANNLLEESAIHPAEWFDSPEKRLQWWFDLEPQWQKAFSEAVFYQKNKAYRPTDDEFQYLLNMSSLYVTGEGDFRNRNVSPCISFQLTNLTGVQNLTNLTTIECDYNAKIESLEPLRQLKKLQTFTADNNNISDLSPLMDLHDSLNSLCLWNNQIKNIEPLASLMKLERLFLGLYDQGNPIESLEPLQYCIELNEVHLNACNVSDLKALSGLKKLDYVFAECNDLERAKADADVPSVRMLRV